MPVPTPSAMVPARYCGVQQGPGIRPWPPASERGRHMSMISDLEGTGEHFSLDRLIDVRNRTRQAVGLIADQVEVGMAEEDAKVMAREALSDLGMRRGWHRIVVRFGSNTTKNFSERSEPGIILAADDIFFVDIGPIFGGCEGDAGDTFVVGSDPEHHRAEGDVKVIWDRVRDRWMAEGMTGRELYDFAVEATESLGWKLNLGLSGHRLSDFPHSAHYDGTLADVEFRPNPNLWVLEIAIVHPEATLRRLLRGPAARGPVVPVVAARGTNCRPADDDGRARSFRRTWPVRSADLRHLESLEGVSGHLGPRVADERVEALPFVGHLEFGLGAHLERRLPQPGHPGRSGLPGCKHEAGPDDQALTGAWVAVV